MAHDQLICGTHWKVISQSRRQLIKYYLHSRGPKAISTDSADSTSFRFKLCYQREGQVSCGPCSRRAGAGPRIGHGRMVEVRRPISMEIDVA